MKNFVRYKGKIKRGVRRAFMVRNASPAEKWDNCPNLAQRPAAPAKNRGRVQRLARRALIILGAPSTSQVMTWTRCRGAFRHGDYRAARLPSA
jgi:hypothetical protein